MTHLLCLSLAMVGGRNHYCQSACFNPCGNMGITYCVPSYQPALACTPVEAGLPVASKDQEGDQGEAVSVATEEELAMAAADRPESLSQELNVGEVAEPVSGITQDSLPQGGGPIGFAGGFQPGFSSPGSSGGFALGNGQGRPGAGLGGGGGSSGGGLGQQGRTNVDVNNPEGEQGQGQTNNQPVMVVTNINAGSSLSLSNVISDIGNFTNNNSNSNVNNNSNVNTNTMTQTQTQTQSQSQQQSQSNGGGGGGEQVPLPATVWMGLMGAASAFYAKRRGLVA